MLEWIYEYTRTTQRFPPERFQIIMLVLCFALVLFFQYSSRLNARAQPAVSNSPRLLRNLARTLMPAKKLRKLGKENKANRTLSPPPLSPGTLDFLHKKGIHRLFEKLDWFVYDKLKLFPDFHTGQRLSVVYFLLMAFATTYGNKILHSGAALEYFISSRNEEQEQFILLLNLIRVLFQGILIAMPLFLLRKNREFYWDIGGIFALLITAVAKLLSCWSVGCCFGIIWEHGVYNNKVEATVFPIQLLEGLVGLLGVALCILYMLFAKSYKQGRAFGLGILFYSVPRFFWDFLRYHDGEYRAAEINVVFGLTVVQVLCVATILLAVLWLILLPLEKKLIDRFNLFLDSLIKKLIAKIPYLSKWSQWAAQFTVDTNY